jgi:NADH dehydrogenase [ubiquinone] 1 alpha subcomplex assembly factor 7
VTPLGEKLRDHIRRHGPITVEAYMRAALFDPAHGYYRHRDPLGAAGDFITAPEISQVFGELIGLWAAVTWRQAGAPTPALLVEIGPGRGTLMADAMRAMRQVADFAAAAEIHLVEINTALRARQRRALAGHHVTWHDSLVELPPGPAIVIANELFDALPVRQFERRPEGWCERLVDWQESAAAFRFACAASPVVDPPLPAGLLDAPPGSICETAPEALALAGALGARIQAQGGAALIVDYGSAESAPGDSLQSLARHRRIDALAAPGMSDLTVHVDFARLAGTARDAGAAVYGPLTQGRFLARLGIEQRAARLIEGASTDQALEIRSGCRRLIDPAQMGTLFKALAITPQGAPPPPGFDNARQFEGTAGR